MKVFALTRPQRFPNSDPLHCRRVFAEVQAQASTRQPAAARGAAGWRAHPPLFVMPSPTLNSMGAFVIFSADLVTLGVLLDACGAGCVKLEAHGVQRPGLLRLVLFGNRLACLSGRGVRVNVAHELFAQGVSIMRACTCCIKSPLASPSKAWLKEGS